ncbi:MAG: hypothetical protein LBQ64_03465, partial [Bacteroidales bacterium]|nr:hypothetical protein [Bacteroidales bacterium]
MKKVILFLLTATLIVTSCEKACYPKRPKNVKSVEWENYNDVYTVYWNFRSSRPKINLDNYNGKTIKLYGWMYKHSYLFDSLDRGTFSLVGDLNTVYQESPLDYSIPVMYVGTDSLPSKF